MTLLQINQLDPGLVKDQLHLIDGITPEAALKIGTFMEMNGPFETKKQFLDFIAEAGVDSRFIAGIAAAVGVTPPVFLFPGGDGGAPKDPFFDDLDPEDLVEKIIRDAETQEIVGREKVKLTCTWRFRVTCKSRVDNLLVDFQGTRFQVAIKNDELKYLTAQGEVRFECKEEDPDNCKPLAHEVDFDQPEVVPAEVKFDTQLLNETIAGIAAALPDSVPIPPPKITSPTLTTSSQMQVVGTNGGRCYKVFIETRIKFNPGKAEVGIKGITFTGTIGQEFEDTFSNRYLLCCCRFDQSLAELGEDETKSSEEAPLGRLDPLSEEACGCGCRFSHVRSKFKNRTAPILWEIEALEGGCKDQFVFKQGGEMRLLRNVTRPVRRVKRDDRGLTEAEKDK